MVDMCREKKTGMAEECCQSDGKWALRACTECSILLGASGVLSKVVWHDFFKMSYVALFWIFCMCTICSSATPAKVALQYLVQSWRDHRCIKLFCRTVRQEQMDRCDSPECKKHGAAEATDVLFHWQYLVKMHSKVTPGPLQWSEKECNFHLYLQTHSQPNWYALMNLQASSQFLCMT